MELNVWTLNRRQLAVETPPQQCIFDQLQLVDYHVTLRLLPLQSVRALFLLAFDMTTHFSLELLSRQALQSPLPERSP